MKPVIIFRHAATEGPGFLSTFLDEKDISWRLVKIDEGDALPASISEFSGMVLMGGPMSVNDDLTWIPPLLALIREAYQLDIPLLGHCLGGQMISKALGAVVSKNPAKEIGWGDVAVSDNEEARRWFGDLGNFKVFHWHGETFSLPDGATHLLSSEYCQNQAYSIGKHLALQCHVEMTEDMVKSWCKVGTDEIEAAKNSRGVQMASEMQRELASRIATLNGVARQIYEHWITSLGV